MFNFFSCLCRCFSYQLFPFFLFSFFSEYFTVEQKHSPGAKFKRKHLYRGPFFSEKLQDRDLNSSGEKILRNRCFLVIFAKFLGAPILLNICERRSYLFENVYHMTFLVTVYLAKECLP